MGETKLTLNESINKAKEGLQHMIVYYHDAAIEDIEQHNYEDAAEQLASLKEVVQIKGMLDEFN